MYLSHNQQGFFPSIVFHHYVILCHLFYLPLSQGVDGIHGAVLATVLKAAPWGSGIRGDPWGWVTCEITIVLGGNNMT
jgi:hypothetical protein